jgi:hypothetical protein
MLPWRRLPTWFPSAERPNGCPPTAPCDTPGRDESHPTQLGVRQRARTGRRGDEDRRVNNGLAGAIVSGKHCIDWRCCNASLRRRQRQRACPRGRLAIGAPMPAFSRHAAHCSEMAARTGVNPLRHSIGASRTGQPGEQPGARGLPVPFQRRHGQTQHLRGFFE